MAKGRDGSPSRPSRSSARAEDVSCAVNLTFRFLVPYVIGVGSGRAEKPPHPCPLPRTCLACTQCFSSTCPEPGGFAEFSRWSRASRSGLSEAIPPDICRIVAPRQGCQKTGSRECIGGLRFITLRLLHPLGASPIACIPGVSLRSTPGYILASLRDARNPQTQLVIWVVTQCSGGAR
jgi:hypothetical protein